MKALSPLLPIAALSALLAGCAVGPDYQKPVAETADLPADWRWKAAEPKDAAPKGDWWSAFNDADLDKLERQAVAQNTDLRQAADRVLSSRAQARLRGAEFVPNIGLDPSYGREQAPASIPQFAKVPPLQPATRVEPSNSFSVPLDLSYEVDLWGRVRRSFEAARAGAQAAEADKENVLLTVTGDVAIHYFTLRELDAEIRILVATEKSRQSSLDINTTRVQAGRATDVDVAQAQTNLTNVSAELAAARKDRAETEHALAILCGAMPGTFAVAERPLDGDVPAVPVDLPAALLERRPDVAAAEREMAAANAQVGVAKAAFFPQVTLTGQGGYLSASASDLFTWQNSAWSFGPSIRFPLFDGGRNGAKLKVSKADYDSTVAGYRGSVLRAVGDVEDSLADLRFLDGQRRNLDSSVDSAAHAVELAHNRFQVGQTNYTEVTVAEQVQLAADRARSQVRGQQFYATVRLIKAMGGGWKGDAESLSLR